MHNVGHYVTKFLYTLRRYGVREALLLTNDFFKCRWAGLDANYTSTRYPSFPPDVFSLERPIDLSAVGNFEKEVPSPAVVLHCHYVELLSELIPWMGNLPTDTHYYVSTDSTAKKRAIEAALVCLEPSVLDVRVLPNRGFDIAPFFVGFRDVLVSYEIVLKIHCKKTPQLLKSIIDDWKHKIFSSLLGSQEHIKQIQRHFACHADMGIIAPPLWRLIRGTNHHIMNELLQKHGITLPHDTAINFPEGTMFWGRTKALKPWLDLNLSFDDFEDSATSPRDGTLAHALERLIFFGCGIEGMHWGRVSPSRGIS